MPNEDCRFLPFDSGQCGYVRLFRYAVLQHGLERLSSRAFDGKPLARHLTEHAEDIQYWQRNPIGGEHTESSKVRLIFKLESPGERALQIHAVPGCEFMFSGKARRR